MNDLIKNKVSESGLITIDLAHFIPKESPVTFDIASYLYKGLLLKEKEFRQSLSEIELNSFIDKPVIVYCSSDAIIPVWAYMLVVVTLSRVTSKLYLMNLDQWKETTMLSNIRQIDTEFYTDARVVVKGCGDVKIPESAYFEIAKVLQPVVKSILFGEPCSTVPVYKKKPA